MFPSTRPEPANILSMVYAGSGAEASRRKEREGGITLQKVGSLKSVNPGESLKMTSLQTNANISSYSLMLRACSEKTDELK